MFAASMLLIAFGLVGLGAYVYSDSRVGGAALALLGVAIGVNGFVAAFEPLISLAGG